MSFKPVVGLTL